MDREMAVPAPRDQLAWFATKMEAQLRENDHKDGWEGCSPRWLLRRLRQETAELVRALAAGDAARITEEAADVANFAMMIADNATTDAEQRRAQRLAPGATGATGGGGVRCSKCLTQPDGKAVAMVYAAMDREGHDLRFTGVVWCADCLPAGGDGDQIREDLKAVSR